MVTELDERAGKYDRLDHELTLGSLKPGNIYVDSIMHSIAPNCPSESGLRFSCFAPPMRRSSARGAITHGGMHKETTVMRTDQACTFSDPSMQVSTTMCLPGAATYINFMPEILVCYLRARLAARLPQSS